MLSRLLLIPALLALLMVTAPSALAQDNGDSLTEVTVKFDLGFYNVAEGGATTITVVLSAEPGREVTIPITVTHQGGATPADYSGVPSTVTFGSEEDSKSFRFTATSDGEDGDESVLLGFGTPLPAGVSVLQFNQTSLVKISDGGEVTVKFEQDYYYAEEGGSVTIW